VLLPWRLDILPLLAHISSGYYSLIGP
jgi:hypothetical protein